VSQPWTPKVGDIVYQVPSTLGDDDGELWHDTAEGWRMLAGGVVVEVGMPTPPLGVPDRQPQLRVVSLQSCLLNLNGRHSDEAVRVFDLSDHWHPTLSAALRARAGEDLEYENAIRKAAEAAVAMADRLGKEGQ